jgi:hypothetical protein
MLPQASPGAGELQIKLLNVMLPMTTVGLGATGTAYAGKAVNTAPATAINITNLRILTFLDLLPLAIHTADSNCVCKRRARK